MDFGTWLLYSSGGEVPRKHSCFMTRNHFSDHAPLKERKRLIGMKHFPRSDQWLFKQTIFPASQSFKARQGIGDHLTNSHIFQMRSQNQRSSAIYTRWHSVIGKARVEIKVSRCNIYMQLYPAAFFLLAKKPPWYIISGGKDNSPQQRMRSGQSLLWSYKNPTNLNSQLD